MKPIRTLLLLALPLLIYKVEAQTHITLAQCYAEARTNYPQIHQLDLINQTEHYNLSNSAKGWLPQLSLNAKATYQSDVTQLPFDAKALSAIMPSLSIPTLSKDQYQVVAEVNQTIWDGGNIRSARRLTAAEAEANRKQLDADLYALNERVNQLYFGSLLQEELLSQNALLQKDLQVNLERVEGMIANGIANQSDKESMQVELLGVQQKAIELKASRSAYRAMLGTLIGRPVGEGVRLEMPNVPGRTLTSAVNRPELHAIEARGTLLNEQNKQITAGLMPRLNAFVQGGVGRPGLNMLENDFSPFYVAGLRLSWNLGKLYTAKNDRRKLETSHRMLDVQRDLFLFNTNLQLLQQHTEIQKLDELMATDNAILRLRTSIKQAAEVKLQHGVISVTDLIREINAEDMARQTASLHRIQQLLSIYNYLYTTNE